MVDIIEPTDTRIPHSYLNKQGEVRQVIYWDEEIMRIVQTDKDYVYVVRGIDGTVARRHFPKKTKGKVYTRTV